MSLGGRALARSIKYCFYQLHIHHTCHMISFVYILSQAFSLRILAPVSYRTVFLFHFKYSSIHYMRGKGNWRCRGFLLVCNTKHFSCRRCVLQFLQGNFVVCSTMVDKMIIETEYVTKAFIFA